MFKDSLKKLNINDIVYTKLSALEIPHKNLNVQNILKSVVHPIKQIVTTEIIEEKIIIFLKLLYLIYLFQNQINLKKLKPFLTGFIFFFFLSPGLYAYVSISKDDKRTDYMGKEIAIKTQYAWDQQFETKINVVLGDEWTAGNLSYHLKSRPVWEGFVEREKLDQLKDYMCLDSVCVGSK